MKSIFRLSVSGETSLLDIKQLLHKEETILLDVRTVLEFARTGITGARHIPVDQLQNFIAEMKLWKKTIITYSSNGDRSKKAARILRKANLNAFNGGAKDELEKLFSVSGNSFLILN